jgi:cytochrome oxidase assembly protein ShyY1
MDSYDGAIIPVLFLVTLLIALALGIWQYRRARRARREHHHSALHDTHTRTERDSASAEQRPGERIG